MERRTNVWAKLCGTGMRYVRSCQRKAVEWKVLRRSGQTLCLNSPQNHNIFTLYIWIWQRSISLKDGSLSWTAAFMALLQIDRYEQTCRCASFKHWQGCNIPVALLLIVAVARSTEVRVQPRQPTYQHSQIWCCIRAMRLFVFWWRRVCGRYMLSVGAGELTAWPTLVTALQQLSGVCFPYLWLISALQSVGFTVPLYKSLIRSRVGNPCADHKVSNLLSQAGEASLFYWTACVSMS